MNRDEKIPNMGGYVVFAFGELLRCANAEGAEEMAEKYLRDPATRDEGYYVAKIIKSISIKRHVEVIKEELG